MKRTRVALAIGIGAALVATGTGSGAALIATDTGSAASGRVTPTPAARARAVVAQLTLDEKITELHGIRTSTEYRYVPPITRLGVPALLVTNGPAGVGPGSLVQAPATALPAPISLAASFDPAQAAAYGHVEGAELVDTGRNLLEAPTINMARVPQSGRTFEGYGEDPYLAGQLAAANIQAIQSHGVIANVKHYLGNNQETGRLYGNNVIDERTLHEIYLPAFETAVKQGHAGSVMCAYPKINGTFSCENGGVLNGILKGDWGFDGFVTSDFGAVHSTVPSAAGGLDLEMPTGIHFGDNLKAAVRSGQVAIATIDDKLVRRYTKMIEAGLFDRPVTTTPIPAQLDGAAARRLAEEGTVLLKNSGVGGRPVLPLSPAGLTSIAVIGPEAGAAKTGGGGSSHVNPLYTVKPVDGIANRAGPGVTVTYHDGSDPAAAASVARAASVAIVMVGDSEAEGQDRPSLALSGNQDALVQAVAAANPRTVVVVKSGGPVLMPWVDRVPAIVEAWYPGEEDGNAVAGILFGDVNPSARLPVTFPRSMADLPANTPAQYPGTMDASGARTVHYSEGVFIGYRHYDRAGIAPLFPFGYGLSYTTFGYSNLRVTKSPAGRVTVEADVTNTGTVAGGEVAQLYLGGPGSPAVSEPPLQLRGFQKVTLQPGATEHVTFTLDARSFSYWDVTSHGWRVAGGPYQIKVGAGSRDLRLQGTVQL
jgi:beta-glucosidase